MTRPGPSKDELKFALTGLDGESKRIDECAETMISISSLIRLMPSTARAGMGKLGEDSGSLKVYEALIQLFADLSAQARDNYSDTARTLRAVAKAYQRSEDESSEQIRKVWKVQ